MFKNRSITLCEGGYMHVKIDLVEVKWLMALLTEEETS